MKASDEVCNYKFTTYNCNLSYINQLTTKPIFHVLNPLSAVLMITVEIVSSHMMRVVDQ